MSLAPHPPTLTSPNLSSSTPRLFDKVLKDGGKWADKAGFFQGAFSKWWVAARGRT